MSRYFSDPKHPRSTDWWKVQFSETLASVNASVDVAISDEKWFVGLEDCPPLTPDPDPQLVSVSSVQLTADKTAIALWIEGGTHGYNYGLTFGVTFPDGSIVYLERILSVYRH